MDEIVHINVGGTDYMTTKSTLLKYPDSIFGELYDKSTPQDDSKLGSKTMFIDRDGMLFRLVLDFLRTGRVDTASGMNEIQLLRREAEFFQLKELQQLLADKSPSVITVGYRGTFAFGRDGLADVKFRKLTRIIVCGKVNICKDIFKDTLNDSRDPNSGSGDRYSSRFFLKHNNLEQAFENLYEAGYVMVGSCGSGTNSSGAEIKPGQDTEENKWQHYNEFIFAKVN